MNESTTLVRPSSSGAAPGEAARVMRRVWRDGAGRIGLFTVAALVAVALLAPWLTPYTADGIDMNSALQPPSADHWLGTDTFGRDIATRLIYGARFSLEVSVLSRLIAIALGAVLGLLSGYFGGWVDGLIMRLADITLAYPGLLLLIAVMAAVGPSTAALFVALGVVGWAGVARLVRSQVLSVKERDFVTAIRSLGAKSPTVLFRHLLPNVASQLIVVFTMGLGAAIMAESSLSFLGLGAQPPTPSWGSMISSGLDYLRVAPWLSLAPGVVITIAVLGFNLLGDALRDALDPKASGGR